MRTKLAIFIVLTFFVMVLGLDYQPQVIEEKPDAYAVIRYMDDDIRDYPKDRNTFYLLFDKFKLDSKNFVKVLSFFDDYNYKIKVVYPYINPLHESTLKNIQQINYNYNSLNAGIAGIYQKYMNELERLRLTDEIDKVYVNGIRIRMIKIEVDNEVLVKFIRQNNGVKYNLTPYGLFKGF